MKYFNGIYFGKDFESEVAKLQKNNLHRNQLERLGPITEAHSAKRISEAPLFFSHLPEDKLWRCWMCPSTSPTALGHFATNRKIKSQILTADLWQR